MSSDLPQFGLEVHKVGKLSEERISGCERVLFVDWGTAAHMG